jgi:hypothetical protein
MYLPRTQAQERSRRQSRVQRVARLPLHVQWLGEHRCCAGTARPPAGAGPSEGGSVAATAMPGAAHSSDAQIRTQYFKVAPLPGAEGRRTPV